MEEKEFKHVIALLLEDAKRLQELEPNAGTEARIWIAKTALTKSLMLKNVFIENLVTTTVGDDKRKEIDMTVSAILQNALQIHEQSQTRSRE